MIVLPDFYILIVGTGRRLVAQRTIMWRSKIVSRVRKRQWILIKFDFNHENPKAFIKTLANLKGRNIIRFQQLAQAQLDFVAQTDETIHPDLRDMRLIVETINEYDDKLYANLMSGRKFDVVLQNKGTVPKEPPPEVAGSELVGQSSDPRL